MNEVDQLPENTLARLLEGAPVGVVSLDNNREITATNYAARKLLDCDPGDPFAAFVHPDGIDRFEQLLAEPGGTAELQLGLGIGNKFVEATCIPIETGRTILFLNDISEKVALSRQLMSTRLPSKRLLHALQTANTTLLGYEELISVMLDEEPVVSGERLTVIKRYHKEMRRCLDTIERLLKMERLGGKRPEGRATPINRKHVVVIDDEIVIAEYLSELMRGMQYKVTIFADPREGLDFCIQNAASLHLVITDYRMPGLSGLDLATTLHESRAELPVVVCAEERIDEVSANEQTYVCLKPLDINELTRMVGELIQ